ncbi:MAG: fibronectin type III domain-containing protein [Candidatus Eisenbacteria bacterium]
MMKAWKAWLLLCTGAAFLSACGISGGPSGGGTKKDEDFTIKDVSVSQLTDSSATLSWSTNAEGVCTASYGLEATLLPYTKSSPLGASHEVKLGSLDEDTSYFYQITCTSATSSRAATQPAMFHTELSNDHSDPTAPVISNIIVEGITPSSATVTFTTDDRSTCSVPMGPIQGMGWSCKNPPELHAHASPRSHGPAR